MVLIGMFEIILSFICFIVGFWLSNRSELVMNWPFVGMLPAIATNVNRFHEWCMYVLGSSGGTYHFKGPWFFNMDMVGTVDPANVKHMMSTNSSNYPKGPEFKEMFDIFGNGLFNSDFDQWKSQRKLAVSLVNHERFHQFLFKTISSTVENELIPVLEHFSKQGAIVDLQDLCHRFTFDITTKVVTGFNPETLSIDLPENEFGAVLDYAEETIFYRHIWPKVFWKLQKWLGFGLEQKMKIAKKTIDRIAAEYLARKRQLPQLIENEEDVDLLASYLMNDNKEVITGWKSEEEFLRDTLVNFLIAGRENSLGFFFWLVAKNPSVQEKIIDELKTLLPKCRGQEGIQFFNLEDLNKLVYLHGAICETLRLYPPVMYEHKEPIEPDVLPSGHHVNPKMKVVLSSYVMGRMKSVWGDDCLEFKPERWISMGRLIQHSPYKFTAFNAGARICVGKDIALNEMKAIAAALLYNYSIKLVEDHPVVPNTASIILHIKHGLMVTVSRRV